MCARGIPEGGVQYGRWGSDTFKGKLPVLKPKAAGSGRWPLSGNGISYRKEREGCHGTGPFLSKVFLVLEPQGQWALSSDKLRFLAVGTAMEESIYPGSHLGHWRGDKMEATSTPHHQSLETGLGDLQAAIKLLFLLLQCCGVEPRMPCTGK